MDYIEKIKNDWVLQNFFNTYSYYQFEFFDEPREPIKKFYRFYADYEETEIKYSMKCKEFAKYKYWIDEETTKYLLLEDGSIAIMSLYGTDDIPRWSPTVGRIAENMTDFFSLIINFPEYMNYRYKDIFFKESYNDFCKQLEHERKRNGINKKLVAEIAKRLGVEIDNDVVRNTAQKFYKSATRNPKFGVIIDGRVCDELIEVYPPYWL